MDAAISIVIGLLAYMVTFNVTTAFVGALFRIPIVRIQFGFDPSVILFRIGATQVRVSPLLLGGYVKFAPPEPDQPFAPWPVRCIVALAGALTALALSAIILGAHTVDEALMAWPQMWTAATDFATPFDPAAALAPWITTGGYYVAAAVVTVKAAMFNLLPLPFLNGGAFLISLWEGATGRYRPDRLQLFMTLSLMAALAFVIVLILRASPGL